MCLINNNINSMYMILAVPTYESSLTLWKHKSYTILGNIRHKFVVVVGTHVYIIYE